ncbi:hypothetical protein BC826DRAFT_1097150 [Russula brevipes]|nr:hypothetical protein BC826DRAFT_1097150 [Russula brevipes]
MGLTSSLLQLTFGAAPLRIRDVQARFNSRTLETGEMHWGAVDLASFMHRLKFQYLENNAKDKYVKTIKEKLKAAKSALAQRHTDIRDLAPRVEGDYLNAKGLAAEAVALTQSILDARLAITRLRQAHPSPRMTIPVAEEQLSSQVVDMQTLEDESQHVNEKIARAKDAIKEGTGEKDQLRSVKAALEKEVAVHKLEADDGRTVDLCDWYTSSLALHQSILNMHSYRSVSENELMLSYNAYAVNPLTSSGRTKDHRVIIVLLFLPNTRQLADVRIEGLENVDMTHVVDSYVQANDVPGLVSYVLSRVRPALTSP